MHHVKFMRGGNCILQARTCCRLWLDRFPAGLAGSLGGEGAPVGCTSLPGWPQLPKAEPEPSPQPWGMRATRRTSPARCQAGRKCKAEPEP